MPSTTAKQARFMAACASGAGYARCPPQAVSEEFHRADEVAGRRAKGKVTAALLARVRGR